MARGELNSVEYFPHSVTHGKGMFYMREKYANDGYAVWFILLEKLGKAEYHYIDVKDEIQLMYLSAECKVSVSILHDMIVDLVRLGEFDRELWEEESILYNQKFVDSIKDAYKKRRNECIDKNTLHILLQTKGRLKRSKSILKQAKSNIEVSDGTQSKVKKSKEEESKTWKDDFDIYKSELREEYLKLIKDKEFIKTQEKFHPNLDIQLSLEKACTNFWATEAGWRHKKKKRSKEINWKTTLTNAIDLNKVYKPKDEQKAGKSYDEL